MSISALSVVKSVEHHLRESKWESSLAPGTRETIVFKVSYHGHSILQLTLVLEGESISDTSQTSTISREHGRRVLGMLGWDWHRNEQRLWLHYRGLSSLDALLKYILDTVRIGNNYNNSDA